MAVPTVFSCLVSGIHCQDIPQEDRAEWLYVGAIVILHSGPARMRVRRTNGCAGKSATEFPRPLDSGYAARADIQVRRAANGSFVGPGIAALLQVTTGDIPPVRWRERGRGAGE